MATLVTHPETCKVTIRLGTRHLSLPTEVYIPHRDRYKECVVDLTVRDGFDDHGKYVRTSCALFPRKIDYFDEVTDVIETLAFVYDTKDLDINYLGGLDIFVNPRTMLEPSVLVPIYGDYEIEEGDPIDFVDKLPATLFHEFCHSALIERREQRLRDEEVYPRDIDKHITRRSLKPCKLNPNCDPDEMTYLYGDELCASAAASDDNTVLQKLLRNADSYTLFALACYMHTLSFDYSTGAARSRDPSVTDGKTVTELSLIYGSRVTKADISLGDITASDKEFADEDTKRAQ